MLRKTFSQEMQEVKDDVLVLGSMVEKAVMDSVESLRDDDPDRSQQVLADTYRIKWKRYEIGMSILVLMATQQPIARDLRTLAASMDICTELKRVGEYAKGIANINIRSEGLGAIAILGNIYSMAEEAVDMLHAAMTTYADEDVQSAITVIRRDDSVDGWYAQLYDDATRLVIRDARNIERANYILWVAHHLERLGDRATNICERVVYMFTGERLETSLA
jgi:phosphate transport system protein